MSSKNFDSSDDDQADDDTRASQKAASAKRGNETFEINGDPVASLNFGSLMHVQRGLKMLASLKLTVCLFACSLILVMAGTVAQAIPGNDIWVVVNKYFRCWFTWLDLYSFHPLFRDVIDLSNVSPKIGIWFPGGFLIGSLMGMNLVAAHSLKFKVQVKGLRLTTGMIVTLIGVVATWLVIESGHSVRGKALEADITWDGLWTSIKILCVVLCGLNGYALQHFHSKENKTEFNLLLGSMAGLLGAIGWLYAGSAERFEDPAMRILWQLGKSLIAATILLGGCVLLFKKRAGVVLLHSGIALMMVNEVVVHLLHVETRMTMYEGDTVNFAEDIREAEFVLVKMGNSDFDEIVAFGGAHLKTAAENKLTLSHANLPFDVRVLEYFTNSDLDKSKGTKRVTKGVGTQIGIVKAEPVAGTDSDGVIDINSAIVQLIDKKSGLDAGVAVVSVWFGVVNVDGQNVVEDSDGNRWDLQLRNKRYYKPYSVTLIDTSRDDYIGTSQVRDYRSIVRIFDPDEKVDVQHHIWMNNPLRYSGETFYQSDHRFIEGRERSVLSVVQNTGWLIPYIACVIVGVGMLAHFWVVLVRFLKRQKPVARVGYQTTLDALFPWAMAIMIAMYFYSKSRVPHTTEVVPDLFKFGQVPVIYEGRDQPLDSLARNSMRMFCKKDAFGHVDPDSHKETSIPAIQWMYDLMTDPQKAEAHRVFRIDHPELREKLHLAERRKGACYAKAEFKIADLGELYRNDLKQALDLADKHRNPEQRAVVEFFNKLRHYENLRAALDRTKIIELQPQLLERMDEARQLQSAELPRLIPPDDAIPEFQGEWLVMPLISTANEARTRFGQDSLSAGKELFQMLYLGTVTQHARRAAYIVDELAAKKNLLRREESILDAFDVAEFLLDGMQPKLPDAESSDLKKKFESVKKDLATTQAVMEASKEFSDTTEELLAKQSKQLHETADAVQQLSNQYLEKYMANIKANMPKELDLTKTNFESFYNHFAPFWYAMFAYMFAFILSAAGMLGWREPLNRAAFYVILVTFLLHTFSLVARIYISGRPPVTNLYASAVFIGWGTVILGMVYESIYKMGIGNLLASLLGAASLGISSVLANSGDTFKVLMAVLDTQFWLGTHVTCITLGYSATFVAGFLGLMHVLLNLVSSKDESRNKGIARMIYGTLAFGIFFSFVGTVLGGLWADDSWGRFWGWDPKENGALMIVIWNALVLHARWDRMVGDRGMAVLAIGGNIITSWSWFGVNELGVGLHSYGFTSGVWMTLWCFWASQTTIIVLSFIPKLTSGKRFGDVEILEE